MGLLQKCERGFKLEATCKSNPFVEKTTMQNGKYIDLEAEPPCVHLAQPLLSPPGQSYMDKTCIALNKNIPFTLVSNLI